MLYRIPLQLETDFVTVHFHKLFQLAAIEIGDHFGHTALFGQEFLGFIEELGQNTRYLYVFDVGLVQAQNRNTAGRNILDVSLRIVDQHVRMVLELFFFLDMAYELHFVKDIEVHDFHLIRLDVIVLIFERKQSEPIDHSWLIVLQIIFNKLVMILAVDLWHQNVDLLVDQFLFQIAEHDTCFHIDIDDGSKLVVISTYVDQRFTYLTDIDGFLLVEVDVL